MNRPTIKPIEGSSDRPGSIKVSTLSAGSSPLNSHGSQRQHTVVGMQRVPGSITNLGTRYIINKDGINRNIINLSPLPRGYPPTGGSSDSSSLPPKISIRFKNKEIYDRVAGTSFHPFRDSSIGFDTSTTDDSLSNVVNLESPNEDVGAQSHTKYSWDSSLRPAAGSGPRIKETQKATTVTAAASSKGSSSKTRPAKVDLDKLKAENERLRIETFSRNRMYTSWPSTMTSATATAKTDIAKNSKQILASMRRRMPNLMRSVGDSRRGIKRSQDGTENKSLVPFNTDPYHMPTDNVFLKKYDPIKLLGRLRASVQPAITSAGQNRGLALPSGRKKKVVMCERSKPRTVRAVCPAKGKREELLGSSNDNQVVGKKTGQLCNGRIRFPKDRPKNPKTYRRKTLYYKCVKKGISESRMRLLAAVYLRRGLASARKSNDCKELVLGNPSLKTRRPIPNLAKLPAHHGPSLEKSARQKFVGVSVKYRDRDECETMGACHFIKRQPMRPPNPLVSANYKIYEDSAIVNTIALLRHKRELQDRLETIDSDGVVYRLGPTPVIAERRKQPGYIIGTGVFKVGEVKQILSERVLVNLAHSGFTHTKLRPVEVLVDVAGNFMRKMAERLKAVTELEAGGVDHGFPDPMERVLWETGLGGVRGAEEYFRTSVVGYEKRMADQCQTFRRQYAHKVRSIIGQTNSTASSTEGTGTNGVTGNCSRTVAISTSNAGSNSTTITPSIPLSPGNSVLAEILSSQEQNQNKTLQGCSTPSMLSSNVMEKQTTGVPPPNVVIHPNMIFSNSPQHTQLVLQTLNSMQSPPVKTMQPHLTQLLQRPVNTSYLSMKKETNYIHPQQGSHISQQSSQYQGMMQSNQLQMSTAASPGSHDQNPTISSDLNHLLINVNTSKGTAPSTISFSDRQSVAHLSSDALLKGNKNKTLTLVRSNSNTSSAIVMNSERQLLQGHSNPNLMSSNNSGMGVYSDLSNQIHNSPSVTHHHQQRQNSNVVSINLAGITNIDLENSPGGGMQGDETVTMHIPESISQSNFSQTVKLKDAASSHRNLLRLNFEQAPNSVGDSTVLLSSSPADQSDSADTNFIPIQFF